VSDHDNDIDCLLYHLDNGYWPEKHAALTALVVERDGLREGNLSLVAEGAALRKRVETLELQSGRWRDQHAPADRDRDLRERLVCAALTGVCSLEGWVRPEDIANHVVGIANATLAAMRKQGGGA
jgi:hypothetical protein